MDSGLTSDHLDVFLPWDYNRAPGFVVISKFTIKIMYVSSFKEGLICSALCNSREITKRVT